MLPDRVSNPGPLTYESGALPIALRGPAIFGMTIMAFGRASQAQANQSCECTFNCFIAHGQARYS